MKDKPITLTVIVLFGILLFAAAPHITAAASGIVKSVICEQGATVVTLDDGRVKVTGMCQVQEAPQVNDAELEPMRVGDAEAAESYVSPYPEPEPLDLCDGIWRALWFCEE